MSSTTDSTSFDEAAWKAVIGERNVAYYLPRFKEQHATGKRALWHWPAFFITFYWLLYRKLWGWAIAFFFVPSVVSVAIGAAFSASGLDNAAIGGVVWVAYIGAILFGPPMAANSLYYAKCKKLIDEQRAMAVSREQLLARLEAKGGTSQIAAILVSIFAGVAVIGILAAIALPAYQDYTMRAKSTDAINAGRAVARRVGDYYERTGQLPEGLEQFRDASTSSRYVEDMKFNQKNGVIEVDILFGANGKSGAAYLIPNVGQDGKVVWTCKTEPSMRRYVPLNCREQQ